MFTKEQKNEIQAFYHNDLYGTGLNELVSSANADLFYGDTSGEDYPGFEEACRIIRDWCDEYLTTLYLVGIDGDSVFDREPDGWVDEDGEWQEPEPYSCVEPKDIKTILFGAELAQYI
jgi:hypothetical protein